VRCLRPARGDPGRAPARSLAAAAGRAARRPGQERSPHTRPAMTSTSGMAPLVGRGAERPVRSGLYRVLAPGGTVLADDVDAAAAVAAVVAAPAGRLRPRRLGYRARHALSSVPVVGRRRLHTSSSGRALVHQRRPAGCLPEDPIRGIKMVASCRRTVVEMAADAGSGEGIVAGGGHVGVVRGSHDPSVAGSNPARPTGSDLQLGPHA
jgi:hypothetical protein